MLLLTALCQSKAQEYKVMKQDGVEWIAFPRDRMARIADTISYLRHINHTKDTLIAQMDSALVEYSNYAIGLSQQISLLEAANVTYIKESELKQRSIDALMEERKDAYAATEALQKALSKQRRQQRYIIGGAAAIVVTSLIIALK